MGRRVFVAIALLSFFGWPVALEAASEPSFVIIVHPSTPESSLDRSFVAEAFLKKRTRWKDGAQIHPVDLRSDSVTRGRFSQDVLKRSVAAVRSYWQQRIFSGRDVPPPELDSEEAVVRFVSRRAGAIGYVSSELQVEGVRVIALK